MIKYDYKYDIYIGYASEDKYFVKELAERLKSDGFKIFWDEWAVLPGDNILQKCLDGLESSYKFLFIMTSISVEKDWPRYETIFVKDADLLNKRRKIIPIMAEECKPQNLLKNTKYINFTKGRYEDNYKYLVSSIKDIESMQIGPMDITNVKDGVKFINYSTAKGELYFNCPQNIIINIKQVYDELSQNAWKWGSKQGQSIYSSMTVDRNEINLSVTDCGNGFVLKEKILQLKELIQNQPTTRGKRGLLTAFHLSDKLTNQITKTDHTITATFNINKSLDLESEVDIFQNDPTTFFVDCAKIASKEIDTGKVEELTQSLCKKYNHRLHKTVVIDMTNVDFICSGGWWAIMDCELFCHSSVEKILILGESSVRDTFFIAGWYNFATAMGINFFDTREEAIEYLTSKS